MPGLVTFIPPPPAHTCDLTADTRPIPDEIRTCADCQKLWIYKHYVYGGYHEWKWVRISKWGADRVMKKLRREAEKVVPKPKDESPTPKINIRLPRGPASGAVAKKVTDA